MKAKIEVRHKGITVIIRRVTSVVNKKEYTNFVIPDYSTGKLVRHVRANLEEAKQKAKEVCESVSVNGSIPMSREMMRAVEILPPH